MDIQPRKASDIILALEDKIDAVLGLLKAQDLVIKLLSNKINEISEVLKKNTSLNISPQITVEAVNTLPQFQKTHFPNNERNVFISKEDTLPIEEAPKGFRRTSRPETYSGDNALLPKENKQTAPTKFPVQIPKQAEVIVPPQINKLIPKQSPPMQDENFHVESKNTIPVLQRVVNVNGKSVFLADVEIIDNLTNEILHKTRTNGAGKWSAALSVGSYNVIIRKREALTKEKVEAIQNIHVDGSKSPLELQTIIIK